MGVGAFQFSGGKKRHVHARSRKEIGFVVFLAGFFCFFVVTAILSAYHWYFCSTVGTCLLMVSIVDLHSFTIAERIGSAVLNAVQKARNGA